MCEWDSQDVLGGFDVALQVDIGLDYPVCPPLFQVPILSDVACVLTLPTAPGGVLDVTEGFVSKTVPCIARSNNLHVIEVEENCWNPFMNVGNVF
jgi:hypothetical protein